MNPDPLHFEEVVPVQSSGTGGRLTTRMFIAKHDAVDDALKVGTIYGVVLGALIGFVLGALIGFVLGALIGFVLGRRGR